ncbi:Variant-specific surface protein, partial [Giardia duodenalis]
VRCYGCTGGCRGRVGWRAATHGWGWAAACSACEEGYFLDSDACKPCNRCATCENAADTCTSCSGSKYLKEDTHTCVDANQCGASNYADKRTWTCKACSEITGCTACAYNDAIGKPKCTACNGSKKVKTALDGTTTGVDVASECADDYHFKADDNSACYLCSDTSGDNPTTNKGIAQCKACTKQNGQAPVCSQCLDGYFFSQGSCSACGANCATCSEANNANKCSTCMAGFFLVTTGENKKCVACDSIPDGGREGCSACSNDPTFKCADCKPNYNKQQNGNVNDDYTCVRTCED